MKFTLEDAGQNLISNYGEGVINVNGTDYRSSLLITQDAVIAPWFDGDVKALNKEAFEPLLQLDVEQRPELVLLGSGATHVFPSMQLLAELNAEGLSVEVMGTRAACRTYSVLVNEHRTVAAALLPIQGTPAA